MPKHSVESRMLYAKLCNCLIQKNFGSPG